MLETLASTRPTSPPPPAPPLPNPSLPSCSSSSPWTTALPPPSRPPPHAPRKPSTIQNQYPSWSSSAPPLSVITTPPESSRGKLSSSPFAPAPRKRAEPCVRPPARRSSLLTPQVPYEALQQLAALQQANGRRRSAVVAPSTRRPSLLPPPPVQHPQPMLTRRGSLMLTATMRAMGQSLPPATIAALAAGTALTPEQTLSSHARRPSNQDADSDDDSDDSDDSDSDSDHDATTKKKKASREDSNQSPEPSSSSMESATVRRPSPPPPYFRLSTFMLEDPDATPPTSPSSSLPSAASTYGPTPQTLPPAPPTSSSQSTPSTDSSSLSPGRAAASSKAAQIDALFREIWQTEESYVAALRGLVTQFFEPLQAFAKLHAIELGAMAALHHSTSTILNIHDELLRQLEPLQRDAAPPSPPTSDPFGEGFTGTLARLHQLSRAFLSTIEYMKVYAFYCGSYLSAKQELERLQRVHPALAAFTAQLNECARRGSQEEEIELPPLDINSSLIKPVQRICRYPLLFKNLLANASGPEETLVLQQSLQKIEAVSNYVNEKVRESQNNARLYQLHQMLHASSGGIELLQPSRTLLHETWANVASLDALRWPAKLLRHFRRRRARPTTRSLSIVSSPMLASPPAPSARDDWFRLSLFGLGGDDRRSSATATAHSMRSNASTRIGGSSTTGGSDRHTSFSGASTTTQYLSPPGTPSLMRTTLPPPARLQRRHSSGGERARLILLSDMLLMAKLKDQKLKIRRQICLSCAVIHDDAEMALTPPRPSRGDAGDDEDDDAEDELLPPESATVLAVAAAIDGEQASYSFTLEVAKVGRCSCHHLSPLTLKRSPKLRSLSAFLSGRRSSVSFGSESGDVFQALEQQHGLSRAPSLTRHGSRTSKATGSRFRYLEQLAGLRSVKRYRVTCDTVQEKAKFLNAMRQAIARSARLLSLGSGGRSGSGSELSLSRAHSSTSAKAVAIAVSLPVKIWRSLRSASESNTASRAATASQSRRRAGSLAVVSSSVASPSRVSREADLLHLDEADSETRDAPSPAQVHQLTLA